MRIIAVLALVVIIAAVIGGYFVAKPLPGDPSATNHPLSNSESDAGLAMIFDRKQPYRLEFGRGSGWNGLDTVSLNESGSVLQYRRKTEIKNNAIYSYWETRSFSVPPETIGRVATLIQNCRIVDMQRAYHADVRDGTQWVFWLVQGSREKSVYFNNHFPQAIEHFAVQLDEILHRAGIENAQWIRVPDKEARQHERAIWNSIKGKPAKLDANGGS